MNNPEFRIDYLCFKFLTVSLSILAASYSFAQKAIPELWGQHVHDEAQLLRNSTVDRLEKDLKNCEVSTSNQVAILIVKSLDGDVLEDYSIRTVENWKLGQKEEDNGVLLLIAVNDHKMRIEVGQGLEGVLTDAQCSRIIRNEIAPEFRRGNYDAGITEGVAAIIKTIGGEYVAKEDSSSSKRPPGDEIMVFGIVIFSFLLLFTFFSLLSNDWAGWRIYLFLIPCYAFLPRIIIGDYPGTVLLIIYATVTLVLKIIIPRSKWGKAFLKNIRKSVKRGRKSSSSSWSSGSSSSGSSSFSGNGGSFGGGGSSGSW